MAVADTHTDDHHHDHGEFIAHHFDSAEQQFDSGKLGIWIFLVTEILFFSGLFVLYVLYRNLHPEIFEQAHVFLDKVLGGINTVVLLFSSLTMALAVRAAQLGNNRTVTKMVLATMVCAAVFLGVKAVEYSHKWDMGIKVRSDFDEYQLADYLNTHVHPEQTLLTGVSNWLVWLSVIPLVLLILFVGTGFVARSMDKRQLSAFLLCMAITVGGYFLGVFGGYFYQKSKDQHADDSHAMVVPVDSPVATASTSLQLTPVSLNTSSGIPSKDDHATGDDHGHGGHDTPKVDPEDYDRDIGIFFSIYYCMTGLHAIHIIGGIVALAWILWRSLAGHWRPDYFGPVEYVGLYWHLVDLIWIYLFPMLYLID